MFISSYATYIPTTVPKKIDSKKENFSVPAQKTFQLEHLNKNENSQPKVIQQKNSSQYSLLKRETPKLQSYKQLQINKKAVNAYSENSQINSFMQLSKAKPAIEKTPIIKTAASKEKAINTYIENDNYYRVTAA